ncbi:MAG: glycosyltransferase [Nitrospinae bacterium]|nr:glycosyltransferase [Nitrospinota bacterium]
MMIVSLALSGALLLIAWTWLRLAKREVSMPIWSTLEMPDLPGDEAPFVSIILPARNEAHNIVRCVESLVRQDYARFEVIVVDDQSDDGTWECLQEMREDEGGVLRVLRGDNPPPGWLGKPYAAQRGVEVASGDWLLFTDADTYHTPGLLSRAMAYARLRELAMLSLAPRQECRTFWEHIWQPLIFQYLDFITPMVRVGEPTAREARASGSFLLIPREVHAKAGGHGAVASEVHEDSALARRVKALGYRIEFVKAMDLLRVRMYRSLRELWQGWSKSLYFLLGARPAFVVAHALLMWAWTVLPFAAVAPALSFGFWGLDTVRGWWDVVFALCTILAVVTILQAQSVLRRVHRQNHFYTVTLPLGGLCLGAAAINALVWGAVKKEICWKGRVYRVSPQPSALSRQQEMGKRR